MPKHADQEKRAFAIGALEAGYSRTEVQSYTGMSRSALSRLCLRVKASESGESSSDPTLRKRGTGRQVLMTEERRSEIQKVVEEEDEDERKVSALYVWEKLESCNGKCLRSVQQVVADARKGREETAETKTKDSNNNS